MGSWKAKYCSLLPCSAAGYRSQEGWWHFPHPVGLEAVTQEVSCKASKYFDNLSPTGSSCGKTNGHNEAISSADSTGSYISGGILMLRTFGKGSSLGGKGVGAIGRQH